MSSKTPGDLDTLIQQAECVRDRAIISLFADSGLRLNELANINPANIDWQHRLVKAHCKRNKDALAVFGQRTGALRFLRTHEAEMKEMDLKYSPLIQRMLLKEEIKAPWLIVSHGEIGRLLPHVFSLGYVAGRKYVAIPEAF